MSNGISTPLGEMEQSGLTRRAVAGLIDWVSLSYSRLSENALCQKTTRKVSLTKHRPIGREYSYFFAWQFLRGLVAYWVIFTVDYPPFTWLRAMVESGNDTDGAAIGLFFGVPALVVGGIWYGLKAFWRYVKEPRLK